MIAIVGSTGFIGRNLTAALTAGGSPVRVLARDRPKARSLLQAAGADVDEVAFVDGDMRDPGVLRELVRDADLVYFLAQTVTSRQSSRIDFRELEQLAVEGLLRASAEAGVARIVSIGLIGASPAADNPWVRSRAGLEEIMHGSGIGTTVLRPGLVVGSGGYGYESLRRTAGHRFGVLIGSGAQRWSYIAIDDLVAYLIRVASVEEALGRSFDVGSEEAPSYRELVARLAAERGGRTSLVRIPPGLVRPIAPIVERRGGLARGGVGAAIDHLGDDLVGNPLPIRELLPLPLMGWEAAVVATERQGAANRRRGRTPSDV